MATKIGDKPEVLSIQHDTDNRTVTIDGVVYSYAVFKHLASPDPTKAYKFMREGETVTIIEREESDLVQFLRKELQAAEQRAEDLARSRDNSVALAEQCRKETVNLLDKLEEHDVPVPDSR